MRVFKPLIPKVSSACVPTAATISCLLVIGFWLRIHNLGLLGLSTDEGHQALAVEGILKHGYPVVPSGMIYAWNILYIYMQSLATLVFGLNEFALRLPGVLFSVVSIPMIYLLGRTLFNAKVGLLAAFLLTFSVWEIEFSRFARAYSVYQFFYILSLFTFYKGFIKGEKLYQFLVPPVFVVTYMLTPLGVTLLMAFLVPFFIDSYPPLKKLLVLLCGVLTAGGFFMYERVLRLFDSWFSTFTMIDTTSRNVLSLEGIRQAIKTSFNTPQVGLLKQLYVQEYGLFLLLFVIVATAVALVLYQSYRGKSDRKQSLLALPIIAACVLHQFTLVFILFSLYALLTCRDRESLRTSTSLVLYLSAVSSFLFWFIYAAWHPVEYFSAWKYFWDYPKLHDYFLRWMFEGWPRFTAVTGIGLLLMGYLFLKDRTRSAHLYVVLLCVLFPLFASFLYWPHYAPRYIFHMYPLLIVVFAFTLCAVSAAIQKRVTIHRQTLRLPGSAGTVVEAFALVLLAVVLSQDAYPGQALAIGNRTYASAKEPPIKASQNWEPTHDDYKTPGLFVKANMRADDIILVLGPAHVPSLFYHYIGRVDYVVMMADEMSWIGSTEKPDYTLATENGFIHYTTGARVLRDAPTRERLLDLAGRGKVWILAERYPDAYNTIRRLHPRCIFTGLDQRTSVYLLDRDSTDREAIGDLAIGAELSPQCRSVAPHDAQQDAPAAEGRIRD